MARSGKITKKEARQQKENKIRAHLESLAGPRPAPCDDPLLTNAGKWFAQCHACKKYEWVPSLVNGGELLQHDKAFSLLIVGRLSLAAVPRSAKRLAASAESQSMLPSPPNTPWKKKPPVPIASGSSQSRKQTTQPTNLFAPIAHASEITPFQECSAPSAWIHL
ncbi:hypothetical protein P691DRAFT_767700, partial [Macrolepiota fuliginosa MF-IS2]